MFQSKGAEVATLSKHEMSENGKALTGGGWSRERPLIENWHAPGMKSDARNVVFHGKQELLCNRDTHQAEAP